MNKDLKVTTLFLFAVMGKNCFFVASYWWQSKSSGKD